MSDRRLARRIRLVVRWKSRRGEINPDQAQRLQEGARDQAVIRQWRDALERPEYRAPWIGSDIKTGIDWISVLAWLLDNWPTILKVLLSLLVFLGTKPKEEPK